MVSPIVWLVVFGVISTLATLIAVFQKRHVADGRFGSSPKRLSGLAAIRAGLFGAFNLNGRIGRSEYWTYAAFSVLAMIFVFFVPTYTLFYLVFNVQIIALRAVYAYVWPLVEAAILGFLTLSLFSASVRRLHDVNRKGFWLAAALGLGIVLVIYWLAQPPKQGVKPAGGKINLSRA